MNNNTTEGFFDFFKKKPEDKPANQQIKTRETLDGSFMNRNGAPVKDILNEINKDHEFMKSKIKHTSTVKSLFKLQEKINKEVDKIVEKHGGDNDTSDSKIVGLLSKTDTSSYNTLNNFKDINLLGLNKESFLENFNGEERFTRTLEYNNSDYGGQNKLSEEELKKAKVLLTMLLNAAHDLSDLVEENKAIDPSAEPYRHIFKTTSFEKLKKCILLIDGPDHNYSYGFVSLMHQHYMKLYNFLKQLISESE